MLAIRRHSLRWALLGSLLLHTVVLVGYWPHAKKLPAASERLEIHLVSKPTQREVPPELDEPLLKNTLIEQKTKVQETPLVLPMPAKEIKPIKSTPPKATQPKATPQRLTKAQEQAALQKLSAHIYYPTAAVNAGLEGTVHLLMRLDANGRVQDVSIAASSGHAVLDEAALRAGRLMQQLNAGGRNQIVLPVTFRLQ